MVAKERGGAKEHKQGLEYGKETKQLKIGDGEKMQKPGADGDERQQTDRYKRKIADASNEQSTRQMMAQLGQIKRRNKKQRVRCRLDSSKGSN